VLLSLGTVAIGGACAAMSWLLARICAYLGLDAVLPVAIGIAAAIVVPWGYSRGTGRDVTARWPTWLLMGYTFALIAGMRYYLSLRFRVAGTRPPGMPPLALLAQVAGLAAEVLTFAVLTLLLIAVSILALVPADRLPRLRRVMPARWRRNRADSPATRVRDDRVPVRLRLARPDEHGKWLRGAMRMAPGSLIWEPAKGVDAPSVELAHATVLPPATPAKTRRKSTQAGQLVALETPMGRADLELAPKIFAGVQELVAGMAGARPADGR
jgi:hypothetical protein